MNKGEGGHRNSHLSPRNASPLVSTETDGLSIRNPAISHHMRRKTAPRALNNNNPNGTQYDSESTMTMSVHEHTSEKGGRKEKQAKK